MVSEKTISDIKYIVIGGAVIAVIGIGYYAYTQLQKFLKEISMNPADAYNAAISNPISQFAAAQTIKNDITTQDASYSNAKVVFTPQPLSLSEMEQQSNNNGNVPIINISQAGVGTFNPMPRGTPTGSTAGSAGNPYNFANGWQGVGWYMNIPNLPPNMVVLIPNQTDYNLEANGEAITSF
ncbi:MAG: hypothetical protein QXE51_05955 [Nitrososphaeria archaeon]